MTLNELKAEAVKKKIRAFDLITGSRDIDPKHTGHASKEHRALMVVMEAHAEIEKMVRKWERENPDKE